jgi:hypothetical protein
MRTAVGSAQRMSRELCITVVLDPSTGALPAFSVYMLDMGCGTIRFRRELRREGIGGGGGGMGNQFPDDIPNLALR